ncbi:hypothetical protein LCGC14_2789150 [marine sediment metagenome]|uniref:Uncharacterized protein n=1 Tax=marine sediment metagenome TaxID=412755 RepID=A0A0F8YR26_9ZZZZ
MNDLTHSELLELLAKADERIDKLQSALVDLRRNAEEALNPPQRTADDSA